MVLKPRGKEQQQTVLGPQVLADREQAQRVCPTTGPSRVQKRQVTRRFRTSPVTDIHVEHRSPLCFAVVMGRAVLSSPHHHRPCLRLHPKVVREAGPAHLGFSAQDRLELGEEQCPQLLKAALGAGKQVWGRVPPADVAPLNPRMVFHIRQDLVPEHCPKALGALGTQQVQGRGKEGSAAQAGLQLQGEAQ